ncbi:hypothetical protein GIB67_029723, partial [Kingdonia uniflora]
MNTTGAIVALRNRADMYTIYSYNYEGYQYTLYTYFLRQFYKECDIYETIGFIFENAAVVFQNCNMYVRLPICGQSNEVTTQGRSYNGLIFSEAEVTLLWQPSVGDAHAHSNTTDLSWDGEEEAAEAEDDYYHMWKIHYVVLSAVQRRIYLHLLTEDKVDEEDLEAGGGYKGRDDGGGEGRRRLEIFFRTIIALFPKGVPFVE